MNRSSAFLLSLFCLISALGQPVLHAIDHLPVPGTTRIIYHEEPTVTDFPTGENQTWDLSWLSMQNPGVASYVAVGDGDPADLVATGATVKMIHGPGLFDTIYLSADTGGLRVHSHPLVACGMISLLDDMKIFPATMSYGEELDDQYFGGCAVDTTDHHVNGDHFAGAWSWGTLIMPWGTVENVLQVTSYRTLMYGPTSPGNTGI